MQNTQNSPLPWKKRKHGGKMIIITSASNSKYKYIKSLYQKKNRRKFGEYTVEGIKSVQDAYDSKCEVTHIAMSETYFNKNRAAAEKTECTVFSDELFSRLCDTETPQGIAAVIKMQSRKFKADKKKCYIYCDNVNDPGNLGTIIRTADAADMGGVLLSESCADVYSPKTVRASMGSFFNIEIIPDVSYDELIKMKAEGFELIGGALGNDSCDYRNADYTKPTVIIVGNEANGISQKLLNECKKVKIPILGKAESLNVGVAAALLMYEIIRNRS